MSEYKEVGGGIALSHLEKQFPWQMGEDLVFTSRGPGRLDGPQFRSAARALSKDHDVSFSAESIEVFCSGKCESKLEDLGIL